MAEEQVFRFMALRQAAATSKKGGPKRKIVYYSIIGDEPQLAKEVLELPIAKRTPENIRRLTQQFQSSDRYVKDLKTLPLDVSLLADWLEENASKKLNAIDLAGFLQQTYGKTPADLVKSKAFVDSANLLAGTLFANALGDNNRDRKREVLSRGVQTKVRRQPSTHAPSPVHH